MLFSIIIPVYNVKRYIHQCIDSVINQDYKNLEIILVNDGSTDGSGLICNEYANLDSRIKVIHQENGGLSVARNTGLANTNGEYVWFIDSDDWIVENAILTLINQIRNDNADIISFYAERFYQEQNKIERPINLKDIPATSLLNYINKYKEFDSSSCFQIFRVPFLKTKNILFLEKMIHEDNFFNLTCLSQVNQIKKIPFILYSYRKREDSITTSIISYDRLNSIIKLLAFSFEKSNNKIPMVLISKINYTYVSSFFELIINYDNSLSNLDVKNYFDKIKKIMPFQSVLKSDKKGVILEKFIYNISIFLYYRYKKNQLRKINK